MASPYGFGFRPDPFDASDSSKYAVAFADDHAENIFITPASQTSRTVDFGVPMASEEYAHRPEFASPVFGFTPISPEYPNTPSWEQSFSTWLDQNVHPWTPITPENRPGVATPVFYFPPISPGCANSEVWMPSCHIDANIISDNEGDDTSLRMSAAQPGWTDGSGGTIAFLEATVKDDEKRPGSHDELMKDSSSPPSPPANTAIKITRDNEVKPKAKSTLDGLRFILNQCNYLNVKLPPTVAHSPSPVPPITNGEEHSGKLSKESSSGSGKMETGSYPDYDDQQGYPINWHNHTPRCKSNITIKKKALPFKKCPDCVKSFSSQFQLQTHIRKWHSGKMRRFPCELCEKAFLRREHLYDHLRMHMGETPYKCEVCNKAFSQNGRLVIHMRSHSAFVARGGGT